ncbi:hypothetical protein ACRRTK_007513 [Alexandromys fortis]
MESTMNLNHLLVETCSCLLFVDMHKVDAQEKVGSWRTSLTAPRTQPSLQRVPQDPYNRARGGEAGSSAPHRLESR